MVVGDAMRYFDRVLSETLASTSSPSADAAAKSKSRAKSKAKAEKPKADKQDPKKEDPKAKKKPQKPWSDKAANDLLNTLRDKPNDVELQEKLNTLRRTYPEEFAGWHDKNSNNPDYKQALQQIARKGEDSLVIWMLKHLISKAEQS